MSTRRKVAPDSNGHVRDGLQQSDKDTSTVHSERQDAIETPASSIAATILSPALITTFVLIFGGCCSNVYTLESIVSLSPATGSLITFLQFLLTSIFTLPSQLTTTKKQPSDQSSPTTSPPSNRLRFPRLRPRSVPLYKWLRYTVMFLLVNMLNNAAFDYRISIPLHIILRSAGPVTSMLVGHFYAGRRYEARKVVAVMFLFSGVVLAALSDASSKGKFSGLSSSSSAASAETETSVLTKSELSQQIPGFILLFSALLISAFMGIYTDDLYKTYGRSADVASENLFYSHSLSLPFFALRPKHLYNQYLGMLTKATLPVLPYPPSSTHSIPTISSSLISFKPLALLAANALTQIVCITGVHRLSTQTTSLTVSIVLNVRKLVSLVLSICLFGNNLPVGVTVGAALVFFGGGLYGWPSSRSPQVEKKEKEKKKKEKKEKEEVVGSPSPLSPLLVVDEKKKKN